MFARVRNALYSVVGSLEPNPALGEVTISADLNVSPSKPVQNGPSAQDAHAHKQPQSRHGHHHNSHHRFPYTRPHFLQLNTDDEIQVSADHLVRPILVPRDIAQLPWFAGYAETINAGKSLRNEDQARIHVGYLPLPNTGEPQETGDASTHSMPYYYFGLFDGHAGAGAAVAAADQLHRIVHEKLYDIAHLLVPECYPQPLEDGNTAPMWFPERQVSPVSLVIGALESAFYEMDQMIGKERQRSKLSGGCTALAALFILGKVFVANAGDSRAIFCLGQHAIPLSNDFTPETESQRIRHLAAQHPELLGGDYTHLEYERRPTRKDLGHRLLYRDSYMTGWAYKVVSPEDLRFPVVYGEGKRSRVLATIGVTRGFGDHDLKAQSSNIAVKPFLSSQPEVRVWDLVATLADEGGQMEGEEDVLVMGTDGLWDVTSNDKAAEVVQRSLRHFYPCQAQRYKCRYVMAAQDLVLQSRGAFQERGWRTKEGKSATIDDISVFVIPLRPYRDEYLQWKAQRFGGVPEEATSAEEISITATDYVIDSSGASDSTVVHNSSGVLDSGDGIGSTAVNNSSGVVNSGIDSSGASEARPVSSNGVGDSEFGKGGGAVTTSEEMPLDP